MRFKLHVPRARNRRARVLAAVFMLAAGATAASATAASATAASADPVARPASTQPMVTTLVQTPEAYAPYVSSENGQSIPAGASFAISCYMTGDTVTGKYGSENVWDVTLGSPYDYAVGFVPDADVYTGSNSPVVPRCSAAIGTIIGSNPVSVLNSPGNGLTYDTLKVGEKVAIRCYTTSSTYVSGPYGSEDIWDQLADWAGQAWVPDALLYTGSNSAVVPHC